MVADLTGSGKYVQWSFLTISNGSRPVKTPVKAALSSDDKGDYSQVATPDMS